MPPESDSPKTAACPVCLSKLTEPYQSVKGQDYWLCRTCSVTFIDASHLPDAATERDRYLLHHNSPEDAGYVDFLNKLAKPLLQRLEPKSEGLDYGCGQSPVLGQMLTEAGHFVRLYDPFFKPDESVFDRTYDFITCTETAEHFHRPSKEFVRLDKLLRPSGLLAIMTCFMTDDRHFANWHYRRDDTHVVFYRPETFHHIAKRFGWHCEIPAKDVVMMRKMPVN